MLTGSSRVEDLIPGSLEAIAAVVENVGGGVAPARRIAQAWQMMTLPGWVGRGGDAWRAFTPKEADHLSAAAAAFNRVAVAMLRYQAAFQVARAEAQAAIDAAKAAEQVTAGARQEHQAATRKAVTAAPGTPEATVPPFTDPGATALAGAQSRVDAARARLNTIGDEVAAEIRAAAGMTSGVSPALTGGGGSVLPAVTLPPVVSSLPAAAEPAQVAVGAVGEFLAGFVSAAWDTVVGIGELAWMLSTPRFLGLVFSGPEGWEEEGEAWLPFVHDPVGVTGQVAAGIWGDLISADLWEDHPAEASGRVTFEALSLLLPVLKIGKLSKAGKAGEFAKAGTLGKVIDPGKFLKPRIDRSTPGGALFPKDYDPLGGLTPDEFLTKYWDPNRINGDGDRGGWKYPPAEGFDHSPAVPPPMVVKDMSTGSRFDRFGNPTGAYVSPEGTSFPERALPPQSAEFDYHLYELVKPFDEVSGFPESGVAAPSFGQAGGGIQLKLPQTVEWLIEHGYLEEKVLK